MKIVFARTVANQVIQALGSSARIVHLETGYVLGVDFSSWEHKEYEKLTHEEKTEFMGFLRRLWQSNHGLLVIEATIDWLKLKTGTVEMCLRSFANS